MHSLVSECVRSLGAHSFIHSFMHFISFHFDLYFRSFVCSFTHALLSSPTHSLTYLLVRSFIRSSTNQPIHRFLKSKSTPTILLYLQYLFFQLQLHQITLKTKEMQSLVRSVTHKPWKTNFRD